MLRRLVVLALCGATAACGSSDDSGGAGGTTDFGQRDLTSLDEACESVPGLTGQAILDQRADQYTTTLGYVTASGERVDPTQLDVEIVWPANLVATCYPPYQADDQTLAAARVAIEGLGMTFRTADGKFDETLNAKAWLPVINGAVQVPQVIAATTRGKLAGTWQPFPEYAITDGTTIGFVSQLAGANTANAGGNVQATATPVAELDAAIFRGAFALATWPTAP